VDDDDEVAPEALMIWGGGRCDISTSWASYSYETASGENGDRSVDSRFRSVLFFRIIGARCRAVSHDLRFSRAGRVTRRKLPL